ncbi:hypothetical protein BJX61DRAFT_363480 [Aspergillus egyptiacus]|nr:hypothetical protein BJX61DRAFT_363480 [Aspergillus egyptiacus]
MSYLPMSPRRGGAWAKVVIFVSLYVLLLESLIQWVVVLYLYGNRHVDSKMAPSLILALIASFLTVPLVVLHSVLAWQCNRVIGYESQRKMLRTVCTYLLRLTILVWLGASVSGVVVVSQQAYCLPDTANGSFWNVGVSCALHRAVVIVSVVSFITVCLYFCSRELCERPHDISLLGVYRPLHSSRDGSILSGSTLQSEKSLKNDILCVCRHPDVTYGRNPYMTPGSISDKSRYTPSIRQPTPFRPTSFLQFGADPNAEVEYSPGTTFTTRDLQPDLYPTGVSRTPSAATAQTALQAHDQALAELPSGPDLQYPSTPKRDHSASSSQHRFLPKCLPVSRPLSADPEIRALAEENAQIDLEKQGSPKKNPATEKLEPPNRAEKSPQIPPKDSQPAQESSTTSTSTPAIRPRSISNTSSEAPEVITLPAPLHIRRSNTSPSNNYYNNCHPPIVPTPWSTILNPTQPRPPVHNNAPHTRRQSQRHSHNFEPLNSNPMPRHTQSQRHPGQRHHNRYPRQFRSDGGGMYQYQYQYQHGPGPNPGPGSGPGTGLRRPRRRTLSGLSVASVPGHLDAIRETGTSIEEVRVGGA